MLQPGLPPPFGTVREELAAALQSGWRDQIKLVGAAERAYAFLDRHEQELTADQVLELRILLARAESLIGRYFGM